MSVPVLWVSLHDDVLARGYADQALLEGLLDRSVWSPPGARSFEHREVRKLDELGTEGAVVVIPSRHHVEEVGELARALDRLEWSVVLLTSEEEWEFDWRRIYDPQHPTPNRRLWVWQPRPEHEHVSGLMPCGWYPGTREALAADPWPTRRRYSVFFGGQLTHWRREECVEAIQKLGADYPALLMTTEGFFQGIPFADYVRLHRETRVTACPSGPESLCTARVEEALEAGAVPLLDLVKPKDPQFDYWQLVFPGAPMPKIEKWAELPTALANTLGDWRRLATRCSAYWQAWKRDKAWLLDSDIEKAGGPVRELVTPDDLVTVIVPTSPVPSNPSTAHLVETIDSIRERLPLAEIVVVADGVRPEQEEQRAAYEEYLGHLVWLTSWRWRNVVPLIMDEWGHQANATRAALELVRTPLVLFCEHDTPLVGEADWRGLCALTMSGEANAVRFHFDVAIHPDHEAGMLDHRTRWWAGDGFDLDPLEGGVPVRRTVTWWQRPHLARADWYRRILAEHFTRESRTMIEDRLYGIVSNDVRARGEAAWWDWRIWVYMPEDDEVLGVKRSSHSDARGEQPKYDMRWE